MNPVFAYDKGSALHIWETTTLFSHPAVADTTDICFFTVTASICQMARSFTLLNSFNFEVFEVILGSVEFDPSRRSRHCALVEASNRLTRPSLL